ncbi:MAG: NAD(P)/FAD-dependent oxidoreductase [Acidimicrobiales bacterium]
MTARVAVVGGGPAGLMAAEVLAEGGAEVTVFDHRANLGRKFLLAGRGGLNLTHSEPIDQFLDRYGPSRSRLEPAVRGFTPDDLREWAAGLGEPTFVGTSGRVFPESFRATPLLRAWIRRLAEAGVSFEMGCRWRGWTDDGLRFERADEKFAVETDATVLAAGGASWPRTGSDGGWVDEVEAAGVRVERLKPANAGVVVQWSDAMLDRFEGTPIKNCTVIVGGQGVRGDPIITRKGLEGGPIYAHSRAIRRALDDHGHAWIELDLQPDLTVEQLAERLDARRRKGSTVTDWLRRCGVDRPGVSLMREATRNALPADSRAMSELIKAVPINTTEMMPIDRAISSAGGIPLDEVDESWMLHKRPGTFVAGEMLDWEGPTGGYLLQATFSTAVAAARGVLDRLGSCG